MKKLAQLTFVIFLFAFSANAQKPAITFESARARYEGGDYAKAATEFEKLTKQKEYKTNAKAWNLLGLSYRAVDDKENSLKAFKKAVALAPADNSIRYNYAVMLSEAGNSKALKEIEVLLNADPDQKEVIYLRAMTYFRLGKYDNANADGKRLIDLNPMSIAGYALASDLLEREVNMRVIKKNSTALKEIHLLRDSVALFEKGLALCGDCRDRDSFEYHLGLRRMMLRRVERTDETKNADKASSSAPDVSVPVDMEDQPFTVISKPRPLFSHTARRRNTSGTVVIWVIFGASGRIEGMILKNSIGNGLDENAMNAARRIRFRPKIKDGKALTTIRPVEYQFSTFN